MGMYDTICGDQVKCFYKQFEYNGESWSSGGSLKCFDIGDEVPYKTDYYDYTKNFNIINIWNVFNLEDSNILTGIRNGRVVFSKTLEEGTESDWSDVEKCISSYGETLRIATQKQALGYAAAIKVYDQRKYEYIQSNMPCRKKIASLTYGIANISEGEKEKRREEIDSLMEKNKQEMKAFMEYNEKLMKDILSEYY
ncbi:hypothetical protein [Enterocloster citroniae]